MSTNTYPAPLDEESFFDSATPETLEPPPGLTGAQRGALALVGVGLLSLVVQAFDGPGTGTWLGLFSSFGLLSVGGSLAFWLGLRDTHPGIKHDGTWFSGLMARGALGWICGVAMTGFYVLLYWYPKPLGYTPAVWRDGAEVAPAEVTGGLVAAVAPLARALHGGESSQWFLYGVLYTLAICVFGVRMVMKYRHNRYQQLRTLSVSVCQLGFAFLLPNLLVALRQPYYELNGVFPLKYEYLWPWEIGKLVDQPGAMGVALIVWGLVATLIATPVLTWFFGKRWYCSWVCGCGGLAETLGDPWRQLSDKSTRAWRLERWLIHGVLVLVTLSTLVIWVDHLTDGAVLGGIRWKVREWYGFYIGALFSGVAGVGLYPLLGSRVWCRFGCPMAAYLGILQRFFSRFRITTNGGQCMSCGNCSTFCEMGIDVRAYAQRGENIVRASCVGCGVCAAVCPRGVLRLENGAQAGDRYDGADDPLGALRASLRDPDVHTLGPDSPSAIPTQRPCGP